MPNVKDCLYREQIHQPIDFALNHHKQRLGQQVLVFDKCFRYSREQHIRPIFFFFFFSLVYIIFYYFNKLT
jgi:hypothetical protein